MGFYGERLIKRIQRVLPNGAKVFEELRDGEFEPPISFLQIQKDKTENFFQHLPGQDYDTWDYKWKPNE